MVNVTSWHACAGTEGKQSYSFSPFATSQLDGGGCSASHPSNFTAGKDLISIVQEGGLASWLFWWAQKIWPPAEFDPQTAQPIASHYTKYTIASAIQHNV